MNRVIIGLLLLILAFSQNNYQQRSIFFSRANNLCCTIPHGDVVNVIINIDDTDRIRRTVRGTGGCQTYYIFCADAVYAYDKVYLYEQINENIIDISFDQQVIKKTTLGLVTHITLKLKVMNPAIIYNKQYNCTILGDGTEHHWGIDYEEFAPAEVYLRCLSSNKLEEIQNKVSMILSS